MKSDRIKERKEETFVYGSSINNFKQFQNSCWQKFYLPANINDLSTEQLDAFWQPHLNKLTKEEKKICILLQPMALGAVKLNQSFIKATIKIVSFYPQLDCDYSALYLGRDRQLLIFRICKSINRFISKYRLPKSQGQKRQVMDKQGNRYYNLIIQRNFAISRFEEDQIKVISAQIASMQPKYKRQMQNYINHIEEIFLDFISKKKCFQITLYQIREDLKMYLTDLCSKHNLYIGNKFLESKNLLMKDYIIYKFEEQHMRYDKQQQNVEIVDKYYQEQTKKNNQTIQKKQNNQNTIIQWQNQKIQKRPPDGVISVRLIGKKKNSYLFQVLLPNVIGVFVRSLGGQFQYTIQSQERNVCISIEGYREGYCSYSIYTFNDEYFSAKAQKIDIYNQLPYCTINNPSLIQPKHRLMNYNLYLQGKQSPIMLQDAEEQFKKQAHTPSDVSMNSAIYLCDIYGDVAGWGLMYAETKIQEPNEQDFNVKAATHKYQIQPPCLLLSKCWIRQVSAGLGYALFLDIFGKIWAMGLNDVGQLGLGSDLLSSSNTQPQKLNSIMPFIKTVKATDSGASFAIDANNMIYRWGLNQVQQTDHQIRDAFGSIINFTVIGMSHKALVPHPITAKSIKSNVVSVEASNECYMAICADGNVFGWGKTQLFGINPLLDVNGNRVEYIVNPIQINKHINKLSLGLNHCVALTTDSRLLTWGTYGKEFRKKPQDFSNELKFYQKCIFKCCSNFTIFNRPEQHQIIKFNHLTLQQKKFTFQKQVYKIQCDQSTIAILAYPI